MASSQKSLPPVAQHGVMRSSRNYLRYLAMALSAVIVFTASTAAFLYRGFSNAVTDAVIDVPRNDPDAVPETTPIDSFAGRALNILVIGVDSREGDGNDQFGSSEEMPGIRSDATMLVHIAADRSRINVVSIPRDLLTPIPSCVTGDGGTSEPVDMDMFNSAFSVGAGSTYDVAAGVGCTLATTELMTGFPLDGFVVVDFSGFMNVIDTMGGVWLDVPTDIDDPEAGLTLSAGCQRLDGRQALGFARARKSLGDGSDISRIERQQALVAAMLREMLSKTTIGDVPTLTSTMMRVIESLSVSRDFGDISNDIGLLLSLSDISRDHIQLTTMPYEYPEWDPYRVVALEPEASQLWESLRNDTELQAGIPVTDGNGDLTTTADPPPIADEEPDAESGQVAPAQPVTPPVCGPQ